MFYFVCRGFYAGDIRSSENNITSRIIKLYITLLYNSNYLKLEIQMIYHLIEKIILRGIKWI